MYRTENDSSRFNCLIVFLMLVVVAASAFLCGYLDGKINEERTSYQREERYKKTLELHSGVNAVTRYDCYDKNYFVPMYMQTDMQWANINYGVGTIGDTGCGLCCGSMAIQQLFGMTINPMELSNLAGDALLSDGVNDISKIANYIYNSFGAENSVEISQEISDKDAVYEYVNNDWLLFGSCYGTIGDFDTSDSGHIVLIYDVDENGFYIRDPYCITNNRQFGFDEFNNIEWSHFFGLRGEHVVKRN